MLTGTRASWVRSGTTALLLLGGVCGDAQAPDDRPDDPAASPAAVPLVFENVRLITMTAEGVLAARTVVVEQGAITAIGDAGVPHPAGALVIDGQGRYLMPALIDMHVHIRTADIGEYVRAGITTVRNMWGWPGLQDLAARIEAGELWGPRIISASPGLDGEPVSWPFTRVVLSPDQAGAAVRDQVAAGWRWIKVYSRLSRASYEAIMAEAAAAGIPAIGHVPFAVPVEEAIALGQRSIEHLTGYETRVSGGRMGTWAWIHPDASLYPGLARLTADAHVWNCPTLGIYAALSRQHSESERLTILRERRAFVRALHDAGADLLAGSDAGIDVVAPGRSLHDELAELVAAGLTPYQALRAATVDAGRFLGITGLGTVAVGAPADLLLLRDNPLEAVGRLRGFDGLVHGGAWIPAGATPALTPRRTP